MVNLNRTEKQARFDKICSICACDYALELIFPKPSIASTITFSCTSYSRLTFPPMILLNRCADFLINRHLGVKLDQGKSSLHPIYGGVPRGPSILSGPDQRPEI